MATVYRCIQNDRLDQICRRHYGTERKGITEMVLSANYGLAERGPLYPAGLEITLPDLAANPIPTNTIRLWD